MQAIAVAASRYPASRDPAHGPGTTASLSSAGLPELFTRAYQSGITTAAWQTRGNTIARSESAIARPPTWASNSQTVQAGRVSSEGSSNS
jgi:hypothetical protein